MSLSSVPPAGTASGFYGCGTRLSGELHAAAFPANYAFAGRKNWPEMHFKPPFQARRPTFASDKTRRVAAGNEPGKAEGWADSDKRGIKENHRRDAGDL